MSLTDFWAALESSSIALRIGESWWFPLLESIHVVAITLVVGTLLMVDLRLLGVAARRYPISGLSKEHLPWTWAAFLISVLTGIGLFITRAQHYIENPAFQIKLALLVMAGINMALFHFGVFRNVAAWDKGSPPLGAKFAASLSLVIWAGAVLTGRWVGHLS